VYLFVTLIHLPISSLFTAHVTTSPFPPSLVSIASDFHTLFAEANPFGDEIEEDHSPVPDSQS
jgi:hypothetical protein